MGSLLDAYKLIQEGTQQTTGDTSMPQNGPEQVCPKCKKTPCQCDSVAEELKGGQVKLDKNKNGKLDADDFKKLRKEGADVPFDPPYTTGFKKAKNPNRTGMDAARALSHKFLQKSKKTPIISGHEEYTSTPDNLKKQHFGTQVKEEVLDEANHRDFASVGMMHPDMAKHMTVGQHTDYYEPKTGDKVHGKVVHKSDSEVHVRQTHDSYDDKKVGTLHKFKIGTTLPEEYELNEGTADQLGDKIDNAKSTQHAKEIIAKAPTKHLQYLHHWNMGLSGTRTHKDMPHIKAELAKRKSLLSDTESAKRFDEEVQQVQEVLTVADGVSKWIHDFVHSTNPKFKGKSVKQRQQMALGAFYAAKKGNVKEQYEKLGEAVQTTHEDPLVTVHDKHGLHTHANLSTANSIFNTKVKHTDVHAGPVQTTSGWKDSNHGVLTYAISQHHSKAMQEEVELEESAAHVVTKNYTWGKMKTIHQGHDFSIPLHPEHHEAIAKLEDGQEHHFKDETGKHWGAYRRGSDVHFQSADLHGGLKTTVSHASMKEETMKSFKDFISEMEMDKNGRYVHVGKYGTEYYKQEKEKDEYGYDEPKSKEPKEKAVKRGRGRPAGSKSGARQIGGASKKGSGVEYTGYPLHLPNSNKY